VQPFGYSKSARRFAPSSESATFQVIRHPPTLTTNLSLIVYSQRGTGNPQTGDRPWLLTSNSATFPLPLSAHRAPPLAWMWLHPLHSTVRRHHSHMTLGGDHALAAPVWPRYPSPGEGHYARFCHPTCPRFPTTLLRKLLSSDGASGQPPHSEPPTGGRQMKQP